MNNRPEERRPIQRRWPWIVLAALLLGTALFILWLWFAVQKVKRIKASTQGTAQIILPTHVHRRKTQRAGNSR
jgi:hypothetical protein